MRNTILVVIFLGIVVALAVKFLQSGEVEKTQLALLREKFSKKEARKKADHSKFQPLQRNFADPREVTATCESCHNLTAQQLMKSNHYNWERSQYVKGRGIVYLGKKNAVNNFCIATTANEKSCAKCHVGLGLDEHGKLKTDPANIDCMVCHDTTGTYMKAPEKGGEPVMTLDFTNIAENVGLPSRSNCGVCHFYGGGGNNVKHGDLEMSMFSPTRDVDVHMGVDGFNMQCIDCHKTKEHNIYGKLYSLCSMNRDRVFCADCHTETPHEDDILNEHGLKVACQTCHIPVYAKVNATVTHWDWSTAGRFKDGKPYSEEDADGNHIYLSKKGSFVWGKNLKPEYAWFNGTASHYLAGDKVEDPSKPVILNPLNGSYKDESAKIIPVKVHRAKQVFDAGNKIIALPKLFGEAKGSGAFWVDFDWQKAVEIGMKEANLPFSGKIGFIETVSYWPVNHMVSSKDRAVKCEECHTREDSRLDQLRDFYMPGRDYSKPVEYAGIGLVLFALLGVAGHGGLRIFFALRRNRRRG
jgi:octaheme c-type cytochrome (tetrathionate reductase family)